MFKYRETNYQMAIFSFFLFTCPFMTFHMFFTFEISHIFVKFSISTLYFGIMFSHSFKAILSIAHTRRCPGILYWEKKKNNPKKESAVSSITSLMLCQLYKAGYFSISHSGHSPFLHLPLKFSLSETARSLFPIPKKPPKPTKQPKNPKDFWINTTVTANSSLNNYYTTAPNLQHWMGLVKQLLQIYEER